MENISGNIKKAKGQIRESFRVTTTRPVAILMIVIGIFVFGLLSYRRLPLNLMPDITYPSLTVRTEYPGTAPEDVENDVSRRIEDALAAVDNLVNMSSISKAGLSDVILEFGWKTDMNTATADVREKLDQIVLPEEAKPPIILRYDPSLDPILRIALYATKNDEAITEKEMAMRLREHAEYEIRDKIEAVEGVAAVRIRGGLERELLIDLDIDALRAKRISPQQIINRVQSGNINMPGGDLREGETEFQVRVLNEFKDLETIRDLIIDRRNGIEIRLDELADVRWENKEREIFTRIDEQPSVELQIFKEADANIVEVARLVRERVFGTEEERLAAQRYEEMMQRARDGGAVQAESGEERGRQGGRGGRSEIEQIRAPEFLAYGIKDSGWKFDVLTDQSIFIQNSIDEVLSNAVIGGILAIIILFLFLRSFKSTIIIGLTIPLSVVATFAPMMLFGVSLNIMSLGGLALGIGMLVDSSIVVLESVFRCREEGDSLIEAVVRGTGEVGGAVIASTLTTIAVFAPIVFVEGVAGQVFGDMSLAVVFSLLAALLCALFFIPMLASRQVPFEFASKDLKIFGRIGSWELFMGRLKRFWSREKGLSASPLKYILFIPHNAFFAAIFLIDLVLDLLGRPFNSAVLTAQRFRKYWGKQRSGLGKVIRVFTVIPVHAYMGLIFAIHFLLEALGKLIRITLLLMFYILRLLFGAVGFVVGWILKPIFFVFGKFIDGINTGYPYFIDWALRNKIVVIAIVLIIAVHAGSLMFGLKSNLIPEVHQGEFNVRIKAPVGTDIERTNELTKEVERGIRESLLAMNDGGSAFETTATVVGAEKESNTRSDEGENTAVITVRLAEQEDIQDAEERAINLIRERLARIPGLTSVTFDRPVLFSFKTPIEVEIKGPERQFLKQYSDEAIREMEKIEGLTDLKNSIQPGNPELQILYDRDKLKLYNMDIADTARAVRDMVEGRLAGEFRKEDRQYDIRVRLQRVDIKDYKDLSDLELRPTETERIKLSTVANIITREGPNEIRRIDKERTALVSSNLKDIDLGSAKEQITERLQRLRMESGWLPEYRFEITGQTEEMEVSSNSLAWALALAVFLVYIVMASQFESLMQPFIIIFTIPLALIGVVYFLVLAGTPVSIVVLIGVIMLAGIVVNNAIVLVDYINQLRTRGFDKMEAIIEAGKIRLRPILMTTLTTVLALLPLALGLGAGAEIRAPMAWTVIAGLLSSTLLTLVVIPTVYALVDRRKIVGAPTEQPAEDESTA